MKLETEVALAGLTTLGLGGPARFVVTPADEAEVRLAHDWAKSGGLPLVVLGGGSNLIAGDAGFDGVVLRAGRLRGEVVEVRGDEVWVTAAAGEPWDAWVAACVGRGWAGVECLAGIPGLVGATPIQNVGAYGQEVSETIRAVRALDRARDSVVTLGAEDCGFGYRDSVFRRTPDRFIVLAVTFALRPGGKPAVRYAELAAALAAENTASPAGAGDSAGADLARVSQAVRRLRRGKSMLLDDPADENRRSVGSFFTNPVVSAAEAAATEARAIGLGVLVPPARMPQFPGSDGRVKLSAAWLIERSGFLKGHRQGAVGISSRHALALVHHGGGTTAELLELARAIRDAVHLRFAVELRPEPVFLGTSWT